ncbi:MAG: carboxypeptidase-like regulatory domain-containing protein [Alphaproteobacteria bacterium]|nr:carboxypeptidase-like regulatory domain-containing protein [Alphaproteobacteria bacterium]
MKKIITGFLFVIFAIPAMAALMSGTVVDENNEPLVGAFVSVQGSTTGTYTDINGKFDPLDVSDGGKLEISFMGYETATVPASQINGPIKLKPSSETINASIKIDCKPDRANGISKRVAIDGQCYPSECIEPRWKLTGRNKNAKCVEQKCEFKHGTGRWVDNNTCKLISCDEPRYTKSGEQCVDNRGGDCTSKIKHATNAKYDEKRGVWGCYVSDCEDGFRADTTQNICVSRNGEPCTREEYKATDQNATGGTYHDGQCIDLKCADGYKPGGPDNTQCIKILTECTPEQKSQHPNATAFGIQDGKCIALGCKCGYKLINGQCNEKNDNDKICTKYTKPSLPQNAKTATMTCVDGKEVCIIPDDGCIDDYELDKPNNKCVKLKGQPCTIPGENNHVKRAVWETINGKLKCVIKSCEKNYSPNDAGEKCIKTGGECTPTDEFADGPGTLKNGKCVPNNCVAGYRVISGKCTISDCSCGQIKDSINNKCVNYTDEQKICTIANAKTAELRCPDGPFGKEVCTVIECESWATHDTKNNRCNSMDGAPCVDEAKKMDSNATMGEYNVLSDGTKICQITQCVEHWEPNADKNGCIRVSGPCPDDNSWDKIEYATAGEWRDGKCVATECEDGYKPNKAGLCIANPCGCKQKLVDNKCVDKTGDELVCTHTTTPKLHENAATGEIACNARGKEYCRVLTCKDGFDKNDDETKCTSLKNDKCKYTGATAEFVKTARYTERNGKLECIIKSCIDGYMVDETTNTCIISSGPCTDEQIAAIEHATAGELSRGKCFPTSCDAGYDPSGDKCVPISGSCTPTDKNATMGIRKFDSSTDTEICFITGCVGGYDPAEDGLSCVANESEQQKIDEARQKYEDAKATEQSLENRMLGAASMGATGIGGMMVASSLAEQNANADAERDMAAYLETFRCDYGAGMNIQGGETGIELPGVAELIPLYAEYVNLANDLKTRKEQLGMNPGIESEPILDSATTGLYDDVGIGTTSGAYASLARAMSDPDGEDAKKWAEQKDKTTKDLKTGAITAGSGLGVGIIGDTLINSDLLKKESKNSTK